MKREEYTITGEFPILDELYKKYKHISHGITRSGLYILQYTLQNCSNSETVKRIEKYK